MTGYIPDFKVTYQISYGLNEPDKLHEDFSYTSYMVRIIYGNDKLYT